MGFIEILSLRRIFFPAGKRSSTVQVYSYYKMLCHFFVPHISPEGTTGPNWLKSGMGLPMGITRGFIEGFLEIRSGCPDMGYPRGPGGGPKILKNLFSIFSFISTGMGSECFDSLVHAQISPSFNHFNVQGARKVGLNWQSEEAGHLQKSTNP